ncbi:MAG: tRNA preQ1(34) S-adenosylmethionine ribosyltransferase-isomerase QueA [Chloroflexi bacterium]|nr:tRNA preQ1(34) S-adenosylmethionine ribosyltransferase-isomerase QueA [Chloroflexota bacterium]
MKTSDFDYELPQERIAQIPVEPRDQSRLLVLNRENGTIEHRRFFEITEYLCPGDVLVLNESRVIPARLFGHKVEGGGKVEFLLLNRVGDSIWESLVRPGRRVRQGTVVEVESENHAEHISVEVQSRTENGTFMVRLSDEGLLDTLGDVPLPPYIHAPVGDPERYQTVYAKTKGSVAAPTAGLHFTPELLKRIESKGIELAFITLHVGLGSFRPVKTEDPTKHSLHQEYCEVTDEVAQNLNTAKREGRRVVGVGTTAVRSVERATDLNGEVQPFIGWNDLYILPGYQFRTIDAMITNFHLPRSTLLMLVAGFVGRERILEAYSEAINGDYRFYSFGDCMLIL